MEPHWVIIRDGQIWKKPYLSESEALAEYKKQKQLSGADNNWLIEENTHRVNYKSNTDKEWNKI